MTNGNQAQVTDHLGRWKLLTIIAILFGLAALVSAAYVVFTRPTPRNELLLRDSSGRTRVRMAAADAGGSIELLDQDGHVRVSLRQEEQNFSVAMFSTRSDRPTVRLLAGNTGIAGIDLDGSAGGGFTVSGADGQTSVFSTGLRVRAHGRSATLDVGSAYAALSFSDDKNRSAQAQLSLGENGSKLDMGDSRTSTEVSLVAKDDGAWISVEAREPTNNVMLHADKSGTGISVRGESLTGSRRNEK